MSNKLWEVDPQTRSNLLAIAKTNDNNKCVDCNAPSPQWASPKFGIFFCLACSGIHRSLGVHISFVRSVTMDAFKLAEVERMKLGGNQPWKDFFNQHASNTLVGRDFESCTISERYDSEAGEEWKERLTARVEEREYVPGAAKKTAPTRAATGVTPLASGRNTPLSRVQSSPQRSASPSQKARNEAYFASKGEQNASRPDHIPPSQGGKYAGFGSSPTPASASDSSPAAALPTGDDFQKDPVAALTKGFGWLSTSLTKQAATVNKAIIQPGLQSLEDGSLAATARTSALHAGSMVQQGARGMSSQFTRFVDPDAAGARADGRRPPEQKEFWDAFGQDPAGPPQEKKGFWDEFAAAGDQRMAAAKPSSIGTSAMKTNTAAGAGKKSDGADTWGEW